MGPGEVMIALIVIGLPVLTVMLIANRFFKFREKKLEVEAMNAAEKAAQYASRSNELEHRVRVLEQIVTDKGVETAAQIEALRPPRLSKTSEPAGDETAS
jgi:hypothetical protein